MLERMAAAAGDEMAPVAVEGTAVVVVESYSDDDDEPKAVADGVVDVAVVEQRTSVA